MRKLILSLSLLCALAVKAEIPAGYYKGLEGKTTAELKTAVYDIIHNLTRISGYSDLPKYFAVTDVYPNSNLWWDMYSNIPRHAPSFSGMNREHSFPKSWWGGYTNVNAYTDLNHLYPSDMAANTAKSNYPLGTVDMNYDTQYDNGITKVGYAVAGQGGGARFVFEPDDEYKGDFARTYFYMVTCYQDYVWVPKYMYMLEQNTYPTLNSWSIDLLLKWSRQDPVSQKEIDRNEAVYGFQNNRNPFIDFPSLAEYIWGNKMGERFTLKDTGVDPEPTGDPNLITPVQDMSLDFADVAVGQSTTSQLFFKGENLNGSLSLRIYSGDKDAFSIPTKSIQASYVNSADGYWLNVTYTPTEVGNHQSRLVISDGGLNGSRGISLIGNCYPVPTLSACTALAASDITDDSYVANWSSPDDVIDYYIVTRTVYASGNISTSEVLAEENYVTIEDFDLSDSESYTVRSVRLGYESPESNVIYVDHSGLQGISGDLPLVVLAIDGGVRFACSSPHSNCVIYDAMGRMVMTLPQIDNNQEVALPYGAYLIVTDQCRKPAKLLVR